MADRALRKHVASLRRIPREMCGSVRHRVGETADHGRGASHHIVLCRSSALQHPGGERIGEEAPLARQLHE
eukprot:4165641-Amphidinium_carterae.1